MVKMASPASLVPRTCLRQASPSFSMQQWESSQQQEKARLNVQSASEVYPCVTFANIPLAKASQMAKTRVNVRSGYTHSVESEL